MFKLPLASLGKDLLLAPLPLHPKLVVLPVGVAINRTERERRKLRFVARLLSCELESRTPLAGVRSCPPAASLKQSCVSSGAGRHAKAWLMKKVAKKAVREWKQTRTRQAQVAGTQGLWREKANNEC